MNRLANLPLRFKINSSVKMIGTQLTKVSA